MSFNVCFHNTLLFVSKYVLYYNSFCTFNRINLNGKNSTELLKYEVCAREQSHNNVPLIELHYLRVGTNGPLKFGELI